MHALTRRRFLKASAALPALAIGLEAAEAEPRTAEILTRGGQAVQLSPCSSGLSRDAQLPRVEVRFAPLKPLTRSL